MSAIYIDADACPVKEEVYKVARRYAVRVVVVANATLCLPDDSLVELVVRPGFGAVDDWIVGQAAPGDVVVTADIPLAARVVERGAVVLDPKGRVLDADTVGEALGVRDLIEGLRQAGQATGGPAPMTPRDRSRFLSMLDEVIHAVRRQRG